MYKARIAGLEISSLMSANALAWAGLQYPALTRFSSLISVSETGHLPSEYEFENVCDAW